MLNAFLHFGLWPVTIAAVALLAAGAWRMQVRLTAAGIALALPFCAYLFIAGLGGLAMAVLLLAGGAMALWGVRSGERMVARAGAGVFGLIVGFFASMAALDATP